MGSDFKLFEPVGVKTKSKGRNRCGVIILALKQVTKKNKRR